MAGSEAGVPEALPRAVGAAGERLGTAVIDRLWLFPPMAQGRREQGLVVASCFAGGDSRRLVTVCYSARRTGKGLYFDAQFADEGVAPPGRLPAMMEEVAQRSPEPTGSPRQVSVGGDASTFERLLRSYAPALFEEELAGPRAPE